MVRSKTPPSAQSDIQSMRHFYSRMGHLKQYEHCHEVYQKAAKVGIIEEDIVRNRRELPERRWANVELRRVALAHSLDHYQIRQSKTNLPNLLKDERVMEELEIFGKLTELERRGAATSEFEGLLNNGRRPLALLVKLADYAVTHGGEDKLEGFIGNSTQTLIRQYSSMDEAKLAMKMDAKAGEKIYAPIAELFGYPELAGDIFLHSFRVNHPDIYIHILATMNDPLMQSRIRETQLVVGELAKVLTTFLRSYGFDAEVTMRKSKHEGKTMNKVLRLMSSDYQESEERNTTSFDEYVVSHIRSFNFDRLNDWVAVRTILHSFRGQDIDQLIESEGRAVENGHEHTNGRGKGVNIVEISKMLDTIKVSPLRLAVKCISDTICSLGDLFSNSLKESDSDVLYYEKKNGYRGFHFDTRSYKQGSDRVLPFEVQLKTHEWHDIAEHGKAAHYYYLGGDNSFVDMIATAYHDIIHPPEAKSSPRNSPPSRRSLAPEKP